MKFDILRQNLDSPIFTAREIKIKGFNIFPYQFSFWTKNNKINQLKRGVYYLKESRDEIGMEEISSFLYSPSYVSLESALYRYNFMPDVPQSLTAVTSRTTRTFNNELGRFVFRHINPKLFFGYISLGESGRNFFLAEPEKAILDYLYLNSATLEDEKDLAALRLNYSEIKRKISLQKIKQYAKAFQVKKMDKIINLLIKNVNAEAN